jgi:hypothetical protein
VGIAVICSVFVDEGGDEPDEIDDEPLELNLLGNAKSNDLKVAKATNVLIYLN